MIGWEKITDDEQLAIMKIRQRACSDLYVDTLKFEMDITAAHLEIGLDLEQLLNFPDADFFHDVVGICTNINRGTGELMNCFLPRCARKGEVNHGTK